MKEIDRIEIARSVFQDLISTPNQLRGRIMNEAVNALHEIADLSFIDEYIENSSDTDLEYIMWVISEVGSRSFVFSKYFSKFLKNESAGVRYNTCLLYTSDAADE